MTIEFGSESAHQRSHGEAGKRVVRTELSTFSPWPKGKPLPDDHKEKIARGKKGLVPSPEHRRAISEGRKKQEEEKRREKEKEKEKK